MKKKIVLVMFCVIFLSIVVLLIFNKDNLVKNTKYNPESKIDATLLSGVSFNGEKYSLLIDKDDENDTDNLIIKNNDSVQILHKFKQKNYLPEKYIDVFSYITNEKKEYVVLVVYWKTINDNNLFVDGYSIYLYDENKSNINEDEELIWFGKWFDGEPTKNDLIYTKKTRVDIINELKELEKEGKL